MMSLLQVFIVCQVQSHEPTMKSQTGSEALRRSSRRLKELLALKTVSAPAELASVPAGVHNKENLDVARPPRPVTPQDLSSSSGQQDSGYQSLHSSPVSDEQYEETDHVQPQPPDLPSPRTTNTALSSTSANSHASLSSSSPRVPLSSSTPRASCRNSNLPIVCFQQAVCAELARSFQKNHRYHYQSLCRLQMTPHCNVQPLQMLVLHSECHFCSYSSYYAGNLVIIKLVLLALQL